MRPVTRGAIPNDRNGNPIRFSDYTEARRDLIARIGEYCSYCEMHLDASLAVEHVQPKQPPGTNCINRQRALDWDNFLLACTNCNSTKTNTEVDINDYLWPDRDNTFRALKYSEGGLISPSDDVPSDLVSKVTATITLTGLDKTPNDRTASDRRWLNRREAWDMATRARERLSRNNSGDIKEQILDTVKAKGYWSIWMTVFRDNQDMLQRLLDVFPGTCKDCFDPNQQYVPVARSGGQY